MRVFIDTPEKIAEMAAQKYVDLLIIFNVPGLTEQTALDIDTLYHG